jgi:hypothetical protein
MATISDIILETRDLCSATSASYPDATMLRRINQAYEDVIAKLICYDGIWQFDDSNFTNLPIGQADLAASQRDFGFSGAFLKVIGVSVLGKSGDWEKLKPIDQGEMGVDPEEFYKGDGMPEYYDKNGSSVYLYPKPSADYVTLTQGLKVYFQRTADIFTAAQVTTGTKEPGFASPFHYILSYKAAIPYNEQFHPDRVASQTNKVRQIEADMKKTYAKRDRDERQVMTMGVSGGGYNSHM